MSLKQRLGWQEVAEIAGGRSKAALRQMVWRKQIPHRKIGGKVVFFRDEIEKWIEDAPGVRPEDLQKQKAGA